MADRLVAWLYDTPVVSITSAANLRVTVDWEPAGLERWGLGSRALSVSLPLGSPIRPKDDTGMDFFSNLLPDGPVLMAMATLAGVSPVDTHGLLSRFGSVCAGALVIVPEGTAPTDRSEWRYKALTLADVANVIDNLATVPFGADIDQGWSPSLPGFQTKVLLGRLADGTWGPGHSTVLRRRGSSSPTGTSRSLRTRRRASDSQRPVGSPSPMWNC